MKNIPGPRRGCFFVAGSEENPEGRSPATAAGCAGAGRRLPPRYLWAPWQVRSQAHPTCPADGDHLSGHRTGAAQSTENRAVGLAAWVANTYHRRMSVPGYQEFMLPLLEMARDGREHSVRDSIEEMANRMGLSEEDRLGLDLIYLQASGGNNQCRDQRCRNLRGHFRGSVPERESSSPRPRSLRAPSTFAETSKAKSS